MKSLRYIAAYGEATTQKVAQLIEQKRLSAILLKRYSSLHSITTDRALYDYTQELKNNYLKKAPPLSKVLYDNSIHTIHDALGLHTYAHRIQGAKIKRKNEIRIGTIFKQTPPEFLRMIVTHELSHLKVKEHNKAFYKLCTHIEPNYAQYEFDMRLYMIHLEVFGKVWE
ncbi:MAG: YgjP-like metallopeptidase domain-containing protein [Campylobacterota bacterium]|nr:YgjP-like metallopeptidase domain-containing protein [Campylobacterota bacterium]